MKKINLIIASIIIIIVLASLALPQDDDGFIEAPDSYDDDLYLEKGDTPYEDFLNNLT